MGGLPRAELQVRVKHRQFLDSETCTLNAQSQKQARHYDSHNLMTELILTGKGKEEIER